MPSLTRTEIGLAKWLLAVRGRQRQRAASAERARRQSLARRLQHWKSMAYTLAHLLLCEERRHITERAENGWQGSTLYGYIGHGDDVTYKQKFCVTL